MRLVTTCLVLAVSLSIVQATAEEDKPFVSLLDGDLSAWQTEGNWQLDKDGVVSLSPRPGEKGWQRYGSYLWLKKKYTDFTLDLEYKHPKGGNSGIYFRVGDSADAGKPHFEIQILDSHGNKGKLTHHDCGGLIRIAAPKKNAAKPAGEWNRLVMTSKGNHVHALLNGEVILDVDLADAVAKDRPATGYIGLQDHGLPLSFRNIRIRELAR